MKFTLTKASDPYFVREIEIKDLSDLLAIANESKKGSIILVTKEIKRLDDKMNFVYGIMDVPEITIYDGYIE